MLLALWHAHFEQGEAPPVPIVRNGGALNKWYAYDLPEEQKEKAEEFVEEYVQELKVSPKKTDIAPIVLKRIDAVDLLNTAIIQEAIRQAEIEYYTYLARRRQDEETALLLLLN